MDRGDHNEDVSVGFVGVGLSSKKLWSFENQGLICKENIHGWVPGLKLKRKKLKVERSFSIPNQRTFSKKTKRNKKIERSGSLDPDPMDGRRRLPRRSPESGRTTAAASVSAGAAAPGIAGGSEEHGEGWSGAAVAV